MNENNPDKSGLAQEEILHFVKRCRVGFTPPFTSYRNNPKRTEKQLQFKDVFVSIM